jgi:hypothetical protein
MVLNKIALRFYLNSIAGTNPLESIKKKYRVDRREIYFLKNILEAYDGIAMFTTVDPEQGIVMLHISPGCEADVDALLQNLKKDMMIET